MAKFHPETLQKQFFLLLTKRTGASRSDNTQCIPSVQQLAQQTETPTPSLFFPSIVLYLSDLHLIFYFPIIHKINSILVGNLASSALSVIVIFVCVCSSITQPNKCNHIVQFPNTLLVWFLLLIALTSQRFKFPYLISPLKALLYA